MDDLTQALAELRRVTPPSSPWEAGDIGVGSSPVDYHIATILNAAASGDLLPVQCCMCGKTGLSLKEGDGGPECELHDGRWVCSGPCWDKASALEGAAPFIRADVDLAVALMVEKACHVLDTAGDSAVTEALGQRLCCSGHDCGCRGADVGTYLMHLIRSEVAPASALAELQALRDERDVAIDSATQQDALRKATLATMRSISAENEDLRTELATLRAQVERLTGAAEALGAMPEGYCFCSRNRIGDDSKTHEPECADLRADLTEGASP